MPTKYFCYFSNARNEAVPVLFYDVPTDGNGKSKIKNCLFEKKLEGDDLNLTFEQLEEKYPYNAG